MARFEAVHVTLPPDVFKEVSSRVRGSRDRSATIARDLNRLYDLYKLALLGVQLTTAEACLVCDALNGTWMDVGSADTLWAEVADGIRLNGLDQKWGVDGEALIAKLKGLDRLTCLALVDAAERFWVVAPTSGEDTRALVQRFFYCREDAGQG